jgi:hypothetical protein
MSNFATNDVLYGGENEKAKAKASRGSRTASKPGVVAVKDEEDTEQVLYGRDEDEKAKAKASRGSRTASKPGVVAVKDEEDTEQVLYGRDEDEKAKAKASRGESSSKPGAERVSKSSRKYREKSKGYVEDPLFDKQKHREKKKSSKPSPGGVNGILVDDNGVPKQSSGTATAMDSLGVIPTQDPMLEDMEQAEDKTKGSSKQTESEDSGSRKRNILYIVIIIILIVIGVVVGVLVSRNNESSEEDSSEALQDNPAPTVPDVPAPTPAPTTAAPSEIPTSVPLFDPPSEEDCAAIANGDSLTNQEGAIVNEFNLMIDVTFVPTSDTDLNDALMDELMNAIQQFLMPLLVGCVVEDNRRLDAHVIRGSRKLDISLRYIILNAIANGEYLAGESCEEDAEAPCYRVSVNLELFLKAEIRFFTLINFIAADFDGSASPLAARLGLADPFKTIKLVGVSSLTPTEAPTPQPSSSPSVSPTMNPTASPTTPPPTATPSASPTRQPVVGPTTESHTRSPTKAPTPSPTPPPTPDPTAAPVVGPSTPPTPPPTPDPTPPPTAAPTNVPSAAPSPLPTPPPTIAPTAAPSKSPTRSPTIAPITADPTNSPTKIPTDDDMNDPDLVDDDDDEDGIDGDDDDLIDGNDDMIDDGDNDVIDLLNDTFGI